VNALVISNIVLWILVLVLAAVLLAVVRQLGVLHERIAPAGALMLSRGLKVGEAAPVLEVQDLQGRAHRVGEARADGRSTLVLFVSPTGSGIRLREESGVIEQRGVFRSKRTIISIPGKARSDKFLHGRPVGGPFHRFQSAGIRIENAQHKPVILLGHHGGAAKQARVRGRCAPLSVVTFP